MTESGPEQPRQPSAEEQHEQREAPPADEPEAREAAAAGDEEPEASETAAAEDEEPKPSRPLIPTWLLVVLVIVVLLITYSALRIAGEQRYQSCVQAVSARVGGATDYLTRLARQTSVKRCSHSPF